MNKNINFKDLKNSPIFTVVILVLVILGLIAGIVLFTLDIGNIKKDIVSAKESYVLNLKEVATLEKLRDASKKAEEQLKVYDGILPNELGDGYLLEEQMIKGMQNFGLTVNSSSISQAQSATMETSFAVNVTGTFANIHSYMNYIAGQKQIQRLDRCTLNANDDGTYTADLTVTVLSESGATNVAAAQ